MNLSLQEALQSRFLRTIREGHAHLNETKGGCVLWKERDKLQALLEHPADERPGA